MQIYETLPHAIVDDFVAPVCVDHVEILYQDDDILLINKPSGLLSLSGKNPLNWDSVHHRLVSGQEGISEAFPQAKLPHRLDFGTSGIMVVGLHAQSSQHLNKQFQVRTVRKHYVAMLEGWVGVDQGIFTAPVAKDKQSFPLVKICHESGKEATSEYKVLERLDGPHRSLVQFTPLTGRTHQLRIHSREMGHPILGCDLYKSETSEQLANRLQLHASDLYFDHPSSGDRIHAQCPITF
tara:strand:+ start:1754 stop:2467 length:714 start_codon:yes stop_codon:yes gene_type:complete